MAEEQDPLLVGYGGDGGYYYLQERDLVESVFWMGPVAAPDCPTSGNERESILISFIDLDVICIFAGKIIVLNN